MAQISDDVEVGHAQRTGGAPDPGWLERNLPWFGVGADFLAIGSGLINLTPVSGRPAAFICFGAVGALIAVVYLAVSLRQKRKRVALRIALALVALAAGFSLVVVGIFFGNLAEQVGPGRNSSESVGGARIVKPVAGGIVQRCTRVEWVGSARPGYVFRLAVAADADRVWVTREPMTPAPGAGYDFYAWALHVGGVGDVNAQYEIRLYEVPERVAADYLKGKDDPHTASELDDDGLVLVHSIKVKRAPGEVASCTSPDEGITIVE